MFYVNRKEIRGISEADRLSGEFLEIITELALHQRFQSQVPKLDMAQTD